MHIRNIY